jgi:preprotein translocase subunit SecB
MKNSPLQLERLVFTKVIVRADPSGNPQGEWTVHTSHEVVAKQKDRRKWIAALDVTVKPKGDVKLPYEIELQVVGHFTVSQQWAEEKIDQLVGVNGCTILYSAAREMVSNLTARGPFPSVLLTSVSFTDEFKPATKT